MNMPLSSPRLVEDLCSRRRITADDVLALRRTVYADGVCSVAEAEAVFRLDRSCADKDAAWVQFYLDSLTDFFVRQAQPQGYVSEDHAQLLIERITHDGRVDDLTEFALLVNIINRAVLCPEPLIMFALEAVRQSVLAPATAVYGSNRPPALVTAADAAIIRMIIMGAAGDGSITVTRREAELVFELNDAVRDQDNAPEWSKLFVQAIANHLMFPRPAPVPPSAEEAKRREAWLAERPPAGAFVLDVGKALGRGDVPFREFWETLDLGGRHRAREEEEAMHRMTTEALSREAIDKEEAAWLVRRLAGDHTLDDNERALLEFIKANSPNIDPSLAGLIQRIGPDAGTRATFGRRPTS